MKTVGHLIGGKTVISTDRTLPLNNPATGCQQGEVGLASAKDMQDAIAVAAAAFPAWRDTPQSKRAQIMFRF